MKLGLVAAMLVLAAVAEAQKDSKCDPVAEDIAAYFRDSVYSSCAVDKAAKPTRRAETIPYSSSNNISAPTCVRATIDFVVDAEGLPVTQTARITFTNDTAYAAAVIKSLASLKYTPAQKGGQPVRQLVRIERSTLARDNRVPFVVKQMDDASPPRTSGPSPC